MRANCVRAYRPATPYEVARLGTLCHQCFPKLKGPFLLGIDLLLWKNASKRLLQQYSCDGTGDSSKRDPLHIHRFFKQ